MSYLEDRNLLKLRSLDSSFRGGYLVDFFRGFFGLITMKKKRGEKNLPKNPQFSRDLFEQNPARLKSVQLPSCVANARSQASIMRVSAALLHFLGWSCTASAVGSSINRRSAFVSVARRGGVLASSKQAPWCDTNWPAFMPPTWPHILHLKRVLL